MNGKREKKVAHPRSLKESSLLVENVKGATVKPAKNVTLAQGLRRRDASNGNVQIFAELRQRMNRSLLSSEVVLRRDQMMMT